MKNNSLLILSTLLSPVRASHWPKIHKTRGQGYLGTEGCMINSRATEWGTDVRQISCLLALLDLPGIYFSVLSSFCAFWLRCWLFLYTIAYIAYNFVFVVGLIIPGWMFVSLNFFFHVVILDLLSFFGLSALTPCFPSASLEIYLSFITILDPSWRMGSCLGLFFFFLVCVCVFVVCLLVISSLHFYWTECLILPSLLKDNSRLRVIFPSIFLLVSVSIEKTVF